TGSLTLSGVAGTEASTASATTCGFASMEAAAVVSGLAAVVGLSAATGSAAAGTAANTSGARLASAGLAGIGCTAAATGATAFCVSGATHVATSDSEFPSSAATV